MTHRPHRHVAEFLLLLTSSLSRECLWWLWIAINIFATAAKNLRGATLKRRWEKIVVSIKAWNSSFRLLQMSFPCILMLIQVKLNRYCVKFLTWSLRVWIEICQNLFLIRFWRRKKSHIISSWLIQFTVDTMMMSQQCMQHSLFDQLKLIFIIFFFLPYLSTRNAIV